MYQKYFKRIFDFIFSILCLFLLLPILILLIIVLFISNKGKVFFIQYRPGINSKPFRLIKFKTMRDEDETNANSLTDLTRVTYIGKILRLFSLDELPQLINVVKGEMSLIGPRPLLIKYLEFYSPLQSRRHDVRPGITGWAQINGRNLITWKEKFDLDLFYVENISFFLDLKILFLTIFRVVKKNGINTNNNVTMDEFKGIIRK